MPYQKRYIFLAILLAFVAYVWGLGSIQIPKIGDEVLYLQIARVTGESGSWLPLRYEGGVLSTKPPLLYWLGMASTKLFGENLWAYRVPVLLVTFLGALLLFALARKYLKDNARAVWATCAYLGFISTYQQGRPFLVNSFEVLFLLLPFVYFVYRPKLDILGWFLCALSWGAVSWSKSFALIVVGFFSMYWASLYIVKEQKISKRLLYFGSASLFSLGIFALWFAFDPDPKLLFQQFIIGENAVKFKGYASYFSGLFIGGYTVFRIWLGPLANAGLYALLVGALVYLFVKNRKNTTLTKNDLTKAFVFYILAFLIFYTLPTQRQENYILPTMAIFAILLARFKSELLPEIWKINFALVTLAFVVLSLAPLIVSLWPMLSLTAKTLWLMSIVLYPVIYTVWKEKWGLPLLVFLVYIQLTCFSEPFNQSFGYFTQKYKEENSLGVDNPKLWVPSRKLAQHERFRFIAPGTSPEGYTPGNNFEDKCSALKAGDFIVLEEEDLAKCSRKVDQLEEVLDFKTRQSASEMLQIALGHSEYLIRKLVLIRIQE